MCGLKTLLCDSKNNSDKGKALNQQYLWVKHWEKTVHVHFFTDELGTKDTNTLIFGFVCVSVCVFGFQHL